MLHRSGLPDLEARLTAVADASTRLTRVAGEVLNLAADFGDWLSHLDAIPDREKRWDCARVEWLNVLHHAGKLEAEGGDLFAGWRENLARILKGGC